jgi:hypothetical protein
MAATVEQVLSSSSTSCPNWIDSIRLLYSISGSSMSTLFHSQLSPNCYRLAINQISQFSQVKDLIHHFSSENSWMQRTQWTWCNSRTLLDMAFLRKFAERFGNFYLELPSQTNVNSLRRVCVVILWCSWRNEAWSKTKSGVPRVGKIQHCRFENKVSTSCSSFVSPKRKHQEPNEQKLSKKQLFPRRTCSSPDPKCNMCVLKLQHW